MGQGSPSSVKRINEQQNREGSGWGGQKSVNKSEKVEGVSNLSPLGGSTGTGVEGKPGESNLGTFRKKKIKNRWGGK